MSGTDVDGADVSIDVRSIALDNLADELEEMDSKALDTPPDGTFKGGVLAATNRLRERFGLDEPAPPLGHLGDRQLAIIHHLDAIEDADDVEEARNHAREAAQLFVDEPSEGSACKD